MKIEMIQLEKLIPYDKNPRHNADAVDKVAASICEYGFRQPIVVDKDNIIIAGHTRFLASKKIGLKEVPVHTAEGLTDAQIKAYRIADNRIAQDSSWDNDLLSAELKDLFELDFDLNLTGFNSDELDTLLNVEQLLAESDENSIPEAPKEPRSRIGDIWILGNHRVMCGDAANVDALVELTQGKLVDLVFTDPPYNLAGDGKNFAASKNVSKAYNELEAAEWDKDFKVEPFLNAMYMCLGKGASVFVCTSHFLFGDITKWMSDNLDYNNYCVWCKQNPMPSLSKRRFTWATELICYGSKEGHVFNFPKEGHALNYLLEMAPSHTTEHPTEKPVSVVEHYILLASKPCQLVLDLFGGSGTTLIVCEKNNRKACLMEINPSYVDVIVKRWQDFTGKKAVLEQTGEEF